MASDKTRLIAVINKNGVKVFGGDIVKVNDNEYNQILNNTLQLEQKEYKEKFELKEHIERLENRIKELEHEIKVLKGEE